MPTRNVVITDHQAVLLEKLVTSGRYQNASEVLREGLRLIENREAELEARINALRDAVRVGVEDADAGRARGFATAAKLKDHLASITEAAVGESRRLGTRK